MKLFTKTLLSLAFVASSCSPAFAQDSRNCGPRDTMVERLASTYGETRQSMGLSANGSLVEMFASDGTGSWTITITSVDGIMCLAASGQSFENLSEALPSKGEEA